MLPLHNSAFSLLIFSGGAEGRARTDMEVSSQQFLRLSRLPVPPLRLVWHNQLNLTGIYFMLKSETNARDEARGGAGDRSPVKQPHTE